MNMKKILPILSFLLLGTVGLLVTTRFILRWAGDERSDVAVGFLVVFSPLRIAFQWGNIVLVVFSLAVLAIGLAQRTHDWQAGILLGIVVCLKPQIGLWPAFVLFDPGEVQTCFDVCGGRNRRYCCVLPALNSTAPFNGIVSFKLAALVRSGRTLRVCRGISTITLTPNTGYPVPDHAWRNCIKLAGSNIVLERRGSLVHCGLARWGPNSSSVGDCLFVEPQFSLVLSQHSRRIGFDPFSIRGVAAAELDTKAKADLRFALSYHAA